MAHYKPSEKEMEIVVGLAGNVRYERFIKLVAGWEEAWGLYQDGWALAATDNEEAVFPLWPAREYAAICASGIWANYEPEPIEITELTEDLLPRLKIDGVLPGIFYTPKDTGVITSVDRVIYDLKTEASKYS